MVYTEKLTAFRMTKCQLCFMAKKTIFTKTSHGALLFAENFEAV